ncbi:MAG TPA: GerMN domain-containing protein [Vicinamibacterales bacterium]
MTRGRVVAWALLVLILASAIVAAFILLPRWYAESNEPSTAAEPAAAPTAPKIKARLFYLSEDGLQLVAVEREVPFGEGTLVQARRIVEAQLERPTAPLVTAIPEGALLRAIYLDSDGDAFVDLSREVSTAHPGGALDELLTVYSIVNAVTANLPAVRAVQILVDGHEVDTLAGHVDLRQPLSRGASWVQEPAAPVAPATTGTTPASPIPSGVMPPRDVSPRK